MYGSTRVSVYCHMYVYDQHFSFKLALPNFTKFYNLNYFQEVNWVTFDCWHHAIHCNYRGGEGRGGGGFACPNITHAQLGQSPFQIKVKPLSTIGFQVCF